ncbi:MAG: autotransporter outer membrane beta-barrel domain-containing protein [Alphaproteobacteria bacterium]|nr:autotransporter outer membrane beta-barrel domain-containing protein [Alphaproteobacteria bacterium]
MNPNQPGCGSYCERHPENERYQAPTPGECDINPNQPGCGSYCERHPENANCQTPTPGDCDINPNQPGCGSYCERHPEDSNCQTPTPGDCDINPNQPGCGSYCERHPEITACKIPYCRTHPNAPVCRENYCETHPHIAACKDVSYCETHQTDYVCKDDSYCDTHPNALICRDRVYCKTHPNEPACKDIAYCVTHPREYVCLDESADGDGGNYTVYYQPEVPAYVAIQRAAIEQNRHLTRNVALGLESDKNIISAENKYRTTRNFAPEKSIWEHFSHDRATIHAPSEAEAEINGFTAGVDLYRDEEKRAGVFGTYTNGDYDFSGKGKYKSRAESKLGIKSYGGGVYYQKDNKNMSLLTTLFAGKQDLDVSAASSYTSASTKAMQYGASLGLSRRLELTEYFDIEPSLGLSYMMIDIDKFVDSMGKEVDFDVVHYLEAELGLRMELKFRFNGAPSRLYVKPSVIKTFASGAKTRISRMGEIETYENELLGRVEVGGIVVFSPKFTGYTSAGYTFGQDYDAYDVNVGLNYRF